MKIIPTSPEAVFLVEYLDLPAATDDPDARWEPFQIQYLNNIGQLAIDGKCRQAGWSWIAAARAIAKSILTKRLPSIFVSTTQDEAAEKIRYGKQIIEALDRDVRPTIIIDNKLELEIATGSRLISHPCRPVRGKARADVYLDEFAHYPKDKEIYTAAVPVTTRGGSIRIGSSPLGATGMFWEIFDEKIRTYPGFKRMRIPWWSVRGLCRDVATALKQAPLLMTDQRVRAFGSERLIEIFENLPLEDFQQEYECAWVDESVSWLTWEEIKANQIDAGDEKLWYRQARSVEAALAVIEEVALAVKSGEIESVLTGGMDVGRKHDLSELILTGKGTTQQTPYRVGISLSKVKFEDQRAVVSKALDILPISRLLIDQNGLGMQLAEELHGKYGDRAQGADFTNANKELWAVKLKVRMQRGAVPIPIDRELSYQIHSIKKKVTASKNVTFDTAGNEQHHADKFWALALATYAA